jgi:hypothetical protein
MSTAVFLTTLSIPIGAILLIFGMKYLSAAVSARARIASEANWRAIAETAAATQDRTLQALAAIQSDLAALAATTARVEQVLKQVE